MPLDITATVADLKVLRTGVARDASRNITANWPLYVTRLNSILRTLKSNSFCTSLQEIEAVPDGKLSYFVGVGGGTIAEIAKLSEIENICDHLITEISPPNHTIPSLDPAKMVEQICLKFHSVALELAKRHANRTGFTITDEYDVQDLMRGLLTVSFEDIRAEEWTPSYGGSSKRMDFLLKREQIVLELKKTRSGLGAKDVGDQLIIDIDHYKQHQNCKTLICFVYDPDHLVDNPRGLESDLTGERSGMLVRVYIVPRR